MQNMYNVQYTYIHDKRVIWKWEQIVVSVDSRYYV